MAIIVGLCMGCPNDPCQGPQYPPGGSPVSSAINTTQAYALGDFDNDRVRDLFALSTSGELRVLQGPSFQQSLSVSSLSGIVQGWPLRYEIAIHQDNTTPPHLYVLDRQTGKVTRNVFSGGQINTTGVIELILDSKAIARINQTTGFSVVEWGAKLLSGYVFVLMHTWDTPSGYVELEFFQLNGDPLEVLSACTRKRASNICVTEVPAEGGVDYLLTEWDQGARFGDAPTTVDVVAIWQSDQTYVTVFQGEDNWRQANKEEFLFPAQLDKGKSRLQVRPISFVIGSQMSLGGNGGLPECPFLGACTCGVSTKNPAVIALNRCGARSPSGAPEVYRLNDPKTKYFRYPWLRDYYCPTGVPTGD